VKVFILPSALDDLMRGFAFCEAQQDGLGDYFLDSLTADIDSLVFHGGIHRKVLGFHRLLAKTFPFAVYDSIEGSTVRVQAVLDCRRDPRWIKHRLK